MIDEGYIKFDIHLTDAPAQVHSELKHLNNTRTKLHELGLIGVYDNGIGYGNLSVRSENQETFVISGTATGAKQILSSEDYCLVDSFNIGTNELYCTGPIRASSESMSHGSVYRAQPLVNCVIHIHSRELFDYMLENDYNRTPESVAFGTPEIAFEIEKLVKASDKPSGIFATAGHDEGIIAYGPDVDKTYSLIFETFNKFKEDNNG